MAANHLSVQSHLSLLSNQLPPPSVLQMQVGYCYHRCCGDHRNSVGSVWAAGALKNGVAAQALEEAHAWCATCFYFFFQLSLGRLSAQDVSFWMLEDAGTISRPQFALVSCCCSICLS